MLAAITDAGGVFRAVHCTWLDLDRPNGKAKILDPDTGEELPSNTSGSKSGNAIRLVEAGAVASRLIIGEGIETVLSVWTALTQAGRDLSGTFFWSAIDLAKEPARRPPACSIRPRRTAVAVRGGFPVRSQILMRLELSPLPA